jgi:hypothetical protein
MKAGVATALIVAFLATNLIVGFTRGEAYPFSTYPMFRTARDGDYRREHFEVVGVTADGRVSHAAAPLGTSLALTWIDHAEGDPERLKRVGALMLAYNRTLSPELDLRAVRITKTTYRIPTDPSRYRPTKSKSEIIY